MTPDPTDCTAATATILAYLSTVGAWVGALATVVLAVAAWEARKVWRKQIVAQRGQAIAEDLVVHGRAVLRCLDLMYYPYHRALEPLRMQPYPQESSEAFENRTHHGWREQTYLDHLTSIDAFRSASFRARIAMDSSYEQLAAQLLDGIEEIRQATKEMEYFQRDVRERPNSDLDEAQIKERRERYTHIEVRLWSATPPKIKEWRTAMAQLEAKCVAFAKELT